MLTILPWLKRCLQVTALDIYIYKMIILSSNQLKQLFHLLRKYIART